MNVRTPIPRGSAQQAAAEHPVADAATSQRVGFDRYVVTTHGPVGYIDVVPPLFVCHLGHPYARAEEIAQVHDFDLAVRIVSARAARSLPRPVAG